MSNSIHELHEAFEGVACRCIYCNFSSLSFGFLLKHHTYFPSIRSDIYCVQRKHCYSIKFSCFKYRQLQLFNKKTGLRYCVHITYLPRPIPFHHCSFPVAAMKLQNRQWPITQLTWFRNVLLLYLDRNDFLDVVSHSSLFLAFSYFGRLSLDGFIRTFIDVWHYDAVNVLLSEN